LKFKVDENLPTEYAPILREAGFEADTVSDEKLSGADDSVLSERCRAEDRVLMTLDLDFANVQAYPPKSHPGIVVFRSKSQDKPTLVALLKRLVPALLQFSPKHQLWICRAGPHPIGRWFKSTQAHHYFINIYADFARLGCMLAVIKILFSQRFANN
jgi:predicted nuclease of predicted toxin-antitoxin system